MKVDNEQLFEKVLKKKNTEKNFPKYANKL